ncbi:TRAP transporter small permease subunit [Alcaligenaceae bacterium]|nr:TRAP transporter small permease subunit [Alcaligenaceae bacterium]
MPNILLAIDRMNTWIGQLFGWFVLVLTLFVTYEVFSRYAFAAPHSWAFDAMNMMYGTLFMMAGAYTLSKNGHVRGDVLYGFFPPRLQASLDLTLYFLFFFPGVIALAWAGWGYASESFMINEHSTITADGPPIYPFKFVIPFAGIALLLQGIVEVVSCIKCLKNGEWPKREDDVEEVDVEKLKSMVHVNPNMEELDQYVMSRNKEGSQP